MVSELKKRPRPRSPSFTTPVAVMNTLAGLMSAGEGEGAAVGSGGRGGGGLGWGTQPSVLLPLSQPSSARLWALEMQPHCPHLWVGLTIYSPGCCEV